MGLKMRRRTVYVATIVAMLAMVGGWALATTTSTSGPAQDTNITTSQPAGFSTATVTSSQIVTVTNAIVAYSGAGTQAPGTAGLAGTPTALGICNPGPCTQNFNSVNNGNTVTAGDYSEQLEISVTQPATGGADSAFDMQVKITLHTGSLVFGNAYIETAVSTAGSAVTVNVYVFVDLGVNGISAPQIDSISVQFNGCLSATSCP